MKKTISTLLLLLAPWSMFNVQCATACAEELYIGSFYVTSTDEEALYDGGDKWISRRDVIVDMFNFEQPDVLGLQSLTDTQMSYLTYRTRMGAYYAAAGDILYNKTALVLDTCNIVDEMPEGCTCSWAKLQKGEKAFYVFNICFSASQTVASTSAARVRTAITAINAENLPVFVVGYLGVNTSKTAYSRFTAKFNDCFSQASVVSAEYGTVNNFDLETNHGTDRYDFIFSSKNDVSVRAYGQLQYGYFTRETDGTYKRRLPSSHFPVMAKVTIP